MRCLLLVKGITFDQSVNMNVQNNSVTEHATNRAMVQAKFTHALICIHIGYMKSCIIRVAFVRKAYAS